MNLGESSSKKGECDSQHHQPHTTCCILLPSNTLSQHHDCNLYGFHLTWHGSFDDYQLVCLGITLQL